jgi:PAS domain S-box-containing protein
MALGDHDPSSQDEARFPLGKLRRWISASLWRKAVLFSAVYFLCAEAGNHLSPVGSTFVTFWLPAGLYLGVLLLNPTRDWLWLAVAVLPANIAFDLSYGTPFIVILCFFCANTIQALAGAWLVRRFVAERPTLATLKEFNCLVGFAVVLSATLGAVIGAGTLVHFGFSHSFEQSWKIWWGSNAMAILLLTPFILTWFSKSNTARNDFGSPKKIVEAILLLLSVVIYEWLLLYWGHGIMSMNRSWAIPILLWAGLRFGARGATAVSLLLSLSVAFFTTRFAIGLNGVEISTGAYIFPIQAVLAMVSLVALIPAIVIGERDRTLSELRESEERFKNLSAAAFEGICISENGRMLDVNNQFLAMFGYERDEVIGHQIVELVAPEWRDSIAERIRAGQETIMGHRLLRKDGSTFSAEAQAKMVRAGDRTLRMTALRDITERKLAEASLIQSEERFSLMFKNSPIPVALIRLADGVILDVNESFLHMAEFTREEIIGHTALELKFYPDPGKRPFIMDHLRQHGYLHGHEQLFRTKSGKILNHVLWFDVISISGEECTLVTALDITERKQIEQAMRESEEKFSKAFQASPDGICITELESGHFMEVNEGYCRIFGYAREELIGRSAVELGIFENPGTRGQFTSALLARGSVRDMEFTTRKRDGRLILVQASAERMDLGAKQYIVSVIHDITDRKRTEEALREREALFRSYFDLAMVGCAITSIEKGMIAVNDQFCQMLGYSREELAKMTWTQLTHPDDVATDVAEFNRLLAHEIDSYVLDKRFLHKDGREIFTTIAVRCVRHPDGSPDYIVGMAMDITSRKRAEAERAEAQAREARARVEYTFQLIASQEAERKRIATELHDSLGQNLLLIKNRVQLALTDKVPLNDLREQLEDIGSLATMSIAEVRQISRDLHPHQLDHLGLTRALDAMIDNAAEASDIQFKRKFEPVDDLFSKDAAMNLYRVLQESLNNILKHSRARHAHVRLERDVHHVQLTIEDDGRGFNAEKTGSGGKGMGLKNIAERVRILGGTLTIESQSRQGTKIEVKIPTPEDK